jgi:hypothetical protein
MTNAINGRRARPMVRCPKWPHYAEDRTMPSAEEIEASIG